jgi:hypothetical protein
MLMIATLALLLLTPRDGLCGPVIISGLDTEYGIRPGNATHGTITMWASVINTGILTNVTSCGSLVNPSGNILVIGGGKGAVGTDEIPLCRQGCTWKRARGRSTFHRRAQNPITLEKHANLAKVPDLGFRNQRFQNIAFHFTK